MTSAPSNHSSVQPPLDALVPPPWPTWRRAVAFALAFLLVASLVTLMRSGAVGPRIVHDDAWGSSSEQLGRDGVAAQRFVPLRNTGWLPVTIHGLEFPQLDGVTWGSITDLPVTIEPGEVHEVTVPFEVDGCRTIDADGYDVFPVRAKSGFTPSRVVEVGAPTSFGSVGSTHIDEEGNEVVLPVWPEQPPSWILDTIDPTCNEPPL